jgi:G6PDH family F420-dependent oxidoreductase
MLEEAVGLIRRLLSGDEVNERAKHFTVEHAQLFTTPQEPPPVFIAAGGKRSAALAGRLGDGLISTTPSPEHVDAFEANGGRGKPCLGQILVCADEDEGAARKTVLRYWPNAALKGSVTTELARPADFEAAAALVTEDAVAEVAVCGVDVDRHLAAIAAFASAGFDTVYVHHVGPDHETFFRFYTEEVMPRLAAS